MYPLSWDKFLETYTYQKVTAIMDADGWRFRPTIQSGVIVVEPKKIDASDTNSQTSK